MGTCVRKCFLFQLSVKWLIVGLLAATLFPSYVNTSTHWVVTEDGKLHAQVSS